MTDLPELSEPTKRKLGILWSTLLDTHGLTGEHLRWRDRQGARRRRIEAQMSPERVSPGGTDSWPDELAVGRKGIAPSVAVAKGRFTNLSEAYWRVWSGAGYEIFISRLDVLKQTVADEVASIWKGHSDAIDQWYESQCQPAVEKALGDLVSGWTKRARRAELERMEHDEWSEPTTAVNWKSPILGAHESAASVNETAQLISRPQAPISHAKEQRSDAVGGGHRTTGPFEDVDTAQPALNFHGIVKEKTSMNRPSRYEVEKFANNAFAIERNRIFEAYAEKQNHVLHQVRRNGNSGGYLPALTKWGAERLQDTILAMANTYAEAFRESGTPPDLRAEKAVEESSVEFAAGTISGIRGHLDLMSGRTRKSINNGNGYLDREIERSRVSAVAKGKLILERQRIKMAPAPKSEAVPQPRTQRAATASGTETEASTDSLARNVPPRSREGTLADTDFWRRAEVKFRRLQPQPPHPGEPAHESHNGLGASWYPWRDRDKWSLDNADDDIKKLFSWAAESAAVELGHPGGPSAVFYWLDLLRRDSPFCKPFLEGGHIYRLCDASAEYCLKCETDARATARKSRKQSAEDSQAEPEKNSEPVTDPSVDLRAYLQEAHDQVRTRSLSLRDAKVHSAVGEKNFKTLTNAEIMNDRNIGKKLRLDFKLKPGEDATKSCLDRIRRAKSYPLSRHVAKKRSSTN